MAADVAVVGLGAMGSMAAWRLASRGARVIGFDRYDPPHTMGSSHGQSRIIRSAYYEGPGYVPLVREAFDLWRVLERESGESILTMTGALMIGPPDSELVSGSLLSAREWGLEHEVLQPADVARRFPRYRLRGDEIAVYDIAAGFVRPEKGVAAALGRARALGATVHTGTAVERVEPGAVHAAGKAWRVDHVIVCVGAWNATGLVPGLDMPLEVTRQCMVWFRPRTPSLHTPEAAPVFVHGTTGDAIHAYGFPSVDGETVKIGVSDDDLPQHPDAIDRVVHPADLEPAVRYVATALPDLDPEPVRSVVCLQENSPDRHFVIGTLAPGLSVLGGFSGHGFKFAPVIGDVAADLALDGGTSRPIEQFAPNRFANPHPALSQRERETRV
ncbi:MAG TPA: N-methyl-L-tryptophan oxidase [Candidatus Dormibacteraeota bacterium]|nr:N-methyl-L-tryptophan oxidase [Candidatus Dormibacteraeota bacterium]